MTLSLFTADPLTAPLPADVVLELAYTFDDLLAAAARLTPGALVSPAPAHDPALAGDTAQEA